MEENAALTIKVADRFNICIYPIDAFEPKLQTGNFFDARYTQPV